ncbi:D-alanyl-D-alanine carboxypeptidase (penicillin-binding protein 5/6) [Tepidamorphus gemmatus]|uniref:serine-type D-Ala-D-Ala carboxypeptidase n=1 Tax=Tepidamorphus gemmatus TaxID=747076 RepID=A0A4R3MGV2_9HYPH|nr:D-alanyl-D-alanine carboxypeptidase (penicillin-binding protein 5/6) [Tepidamorphus gemmatus]
MSVHWTARTHRPDRRPWNAVFARAVVVLLGLVVAASPIAQAQPIETAAPSAYMIDDATGTILISKNPDTPLAPASMAKLMTLELAFQAIKEGRLSLDDEFFISENAWRRGGAPSRTSTMFAAVKSNVRLEDLLRGIMVQNANDACIAIAEGMAGSEAAFAGLMNQRARELGLTHSTFVNATGLPERDGPRQTMSTRDLVTLARHVINEYPDLYRLFSEPEFTWNKIRQTNRNPLIGQTIGVDGLLTGYDETDGFGMIASAVLDGQRIIVAVNGLKTSNERFSEVQKLLGWAARSFEKLSLFAAGEPVGAIGVYGGEIGSVPVAAHQPIEVLIPRGVRSKLRARIVYLGPLRAPVAEGQRVGEFQVFNDDQLIGTAPVFATRDVDVGPLYSRALDAAYQMVVELIHSGVDAATNR